MCCDVMRGCGGGVRLGTCRDDNEKEEEIYIGFDVCWNRAF